MKLQIPENPNYTATVVSLKAITPLEKMDNVVGTPIFGSQAIVGKDYKVGDIGIVFPAETQLSEEYARMNNLHRHGNLNDDEAAKGYLEDNRRVKAVKFMGHRSDCLFMPLESLAFTGVDTGDLKEGDTFDQLSGKEICKKYLVKRTSGQNRLEKNKKKGFERIDKKFLPEHYDTENYFKNEHVIPGYKRIVVTQKLHGTSIRIGHTHVRRKLKPHERVAKLLGVKVQENELDYVFGSRKVIKDINNPNQNHYYQTEGYDMYTTEGKKLQGLIPENFLLYGELIGFTPEGAPLQPDYTYNVPDKTCDLYIYRIAFINGQGRMIDLSWDQVKEFCTDLGLKHVPELWVGQHEDFNAEEWRDTRFYDKLHGGYKNAVPLGSNKKLVDEGVCIRVDGLAPYILKAKSPIFLAWETKKMDEEAYDAEAEASLEEVES